MNIWKRLAEIAKLKGLVERAIETYDNPSYEGDYLDALAGVLLELGFTIVSNERFIALTSQ